MPTPPTGPKATEEPGPPGPGTEELGPGGRRLLRWPPRPDDPLRAWDGADTYLLEALRERFPERADGPVLVVDDAFGALACALPRARSWGDLETARLALEANLDRNGLPAVPFTPFTEPPPPAGAALVRIPRGSRRLRWILARLAEALPAGTPVLLGAKSKEVQKSTVRAAELTIGPAAATRARHRARLVIAERDGRRPQEAAERRGSLPGGLPIRAFPGVFGEEGLDGGTALLLREIPEGLAGTVVDLGCGAGALGLVAGARSPACRLVFRDASHLAIASARRAFEDSELPNEARFEAADAMEGVPDGSVDLVLCNPPFHEGRTITRATAARMFRGAAGALRPGGRLLVVGNRHLGYHTGLKRWFGAVRVLRSDPRFVVLEAR